MFSMRFAYGSTGSPRTDCKDFTGTVHQLSATSLFSIDDPIRDGFPLGSGSRQIVEREIVSQLMDQKGAIELWNQDPVRMRDVEREGDTILCLSPIPGTPY